MPAAAWAVLGLIGAVLLHPKPSPCPPVVAYTAEQEKALAVSISKLQPSDPLVGMTADYLALRKTVKACAK